MEAIEGKPDGEWTNLYALAPNGDRAEVESLRRAVKTLEARGLVETEKITVVNPWSNEDRLRTSMRHARQDWGMYPGKWNPQTLGFRLLASPAHKLKEAEHQLQQVGMFLKLDLVKDHAAAREQVRELADTITALKAQITDGK